MKPLRILLALLVAGLSLAVHAHAFLERAEPRVGSTVAAAPPAVTLWFADDIDPAFTRVTVVDAKGQRVDAGHSHVDPANPSVVRVPLARLGPGEYTVIWHAAAADTHATEGRFTFRVAP